MAAFRAKQALVDGDQAGCWDALREASVLSRAVDGMAADKDKTNGSTSGSAAGKGVSAHMQQSARLIAFQLLLETRIALYHCRAHMGKVRPPLRWCFVLKKF
jgi:hypothetical protein